jgi:cell wall-associated NlpC family hydrolase
MDMKELTYELISSFLNKPYIWGGKNPVVGMDCSGLVCELLQSMGLLKNNEEYNAQTLYAKFMGGSVEQKVPEFGSLIFFGKDFQGISHVGFGLNSFQMLEAGGGTEITVSESVAARQNAFVKIRPFNHRSDLLSILKPKYPWEK